jgi:pimeloyl-ACP methyl ester carboxylesterase
VGDKAMSIKKRLLIGSGIAIVLCGVTIAVLVFLLVHRVEGEYFDANGCRIHYTVEGRGEPVILVHGVAATADLNWRYPGVIRALSKNFKVIAFDLRGHGLSGKPHEVDEYGIQMVEDIVRLMDHLHIQKAHVAGYSLGGFLLLKLLATHPDRVASAAICAAGWKNPDDPSPLPNPYTAPKADARKWLDASLSAPVAATSKSLFHRVRNAVGDRLMDKTAKKALKQKYAELAVSEADLKAIHVPAICFIGTQDGFLFLARDLRAHMPGIEFCQIVGAGHFTTPFRRVFKADLRDFFIRHQGAPQ